MKTIWASKTFIQVNIYVPKISNMDHLWEMLRRIIQKLLHCKQWLLSYLVKISWRLYRDRGYIFTVNRKSLIAFSTYISWDCLNLQALFDVHIHRRTICFCLRRYTWSFKALAKYIINTHYNRTSNKYNDYKYFIYSSTTAADQDLPLRCPLECFYACFLRRAKKYI